MSASVQTLTSAIEPCSNHEHSGGDDHDNDDDSSTDRNDNLSSTPVCPYDSWTFRSLSTNTRSPNLPHHLLRPTMAAQPMAQTNVPVSSIENQFQNWQSSIALACQHLQPRLSMRRHLPLCPLMLRSLLYLKRYRRQVQHHVQQ
jgi:hypothetical protein